MAAAATVHANWATTVDEISAAPKSTTNQGKRVRIARGRHRLLVHMVKPVYVLCGLLLDSEENLRAVGRPVPSKEVDHCACIATPQKSLDAFNQSVDGCRSDHLYQ